MKCSPQFKKENAQVETWSNMMYVLKYLMFHNFSYQFSINKEKNKVKYTNYFI